MKVVLKKKEDKKKIYALAVLGVIAAYMLYSTFSSSDQPATTPAGIPARASAPIPDATTAPAPQRRGITARGSTNFQPHVHSNRPEDRIDPNKIDPTLRLDLLAKVQGVTLEGGSRNLFQFGTAAPVVVANQKPIPKVAKIPINGPQPAPVIVANPIPPDPTAPPIPLKYYGFTNSKGEPRKRAFFLDGEEIIVAREGETVKSRYRIVHIGVNSIEMEDTQFKSKQTLPLEPEPVV